MNFPLLFLLLLLCCVFGAIELATNRSYGIFFAVLAVLFVLVIASRSVYDTRDTFNYVNAFEHINVNSGLNVWEWNKTTFESGYMLMNLILKWAGFDYRGLLIVVTLFQMFAYFYGINNILTENKLYRRKHFYCVSFSIIFRVLRNVLFRHSAEGWYCAHVVFSGLYVCEAQKVFSCNVSWLPCVYVP